MNLNSEYVMRMTLKVKSKTTWRVNKHSILFHISYYVFHYLHASKINYTYLCMQMKLNDEIDKNNTLLKRIKESTTAWQEQTLKH